MGRLCRGAVAAGLVIGTHLGPWGCAMSSHRIPTLNEQVRAEIGTLGVASSSIVPSSDLRPPTGGKGSGAAKGAGSAAAAIAMAPGSGGNPLLKAIVILGLTPIAAAGGAIYGAVMAPSAEKVKEAETALARASVDLKPKEAILDQVLKAARGRIAHRVVSVGETPDVDAVLEIGVLSVGLAGATALNIDPPLQVVVVACPKLVRRADGRELYPAESPAPAFVHMSAPRRFLEWGGDDARLFRQETARAYQSLAERVVEEIFVVFHPTGSRWWLEDQGSGPTCPAGAELKR